MSDYVSNTSLTDIAKTLRGAERIVLTAHAKPDGDAIGAVLALARALEEVGKSVQRWFMPPVLGSLNALLEGEQITLVDADPGAQPGPEPDCIVVADTGAWSQLEPITDYLAHRRDKVIVIDHHLRGDDVGALRYVDTSAAAACEIIAELIDALGVAFDEPIRRALYVGIASDTGWFRFSNTRPETHELAARLLRDGVDHSPLYARLEQGERPEKLRLLIRALDGMQLINGGAAVMTLRRSDFEDTNARPEETDRFVDLPQIVRDVQVVVLIIEPAEGVTKLSYRSKPGPNAVDVNQLAQQFGGGGHARAAGATVRQPLDAVQRQVLAQLEALESAGATS